MGDILNYGVYLNDPKQLRDRSAFGAITQITIPLMISHTELDRPDAILQADRVNNALCTASHCLTYAVFKDHSHVSQVYSIGTPDNSASGQVLRFLTLLK